MDASADLAFAFPLEQLLSAPARTAAARAAAAIRVVSISNNNDHKPLPPARQTPAPTSLL
jgi:hypothetical protein